MKILRLENGFWDSIPKRCKGLYCVDLGESFLIPTSISLQILGSIQPRTSLIQFFYFSTIKGFNFSLCIPSVSLRAAAERSCWLKDFRGAGTGPYWSVPIPKFAHGPVGCLGWRQPTLRSAHPLHVARSKFCKRLLQRPQRPREERSP